MRTKIIALAVLLAAQSHAQTLLSYTNVRADVSGGPAFSATALAGPLRITYVVEDTPGVPLNLDDGTTFRLEAWAADGVRVQNVASTNLVNTDLSAGQVRFTVPSLGAGEYRIRGVAQPAGGDTTLVWQITHHMLTITNAPSAAASIGNLTVQWEIQGDGDMAPDSTDRNIVPHTDLGSSIGKTNERFAEAHINEGYFGTIRAGTVDVETAVGFLDNTKVKKSGETDTVDLTNTSLQVRSPTNDTEAATKAYVDGLSGGASYIDYIGSYTYTGGEVQVTVAWTQQYELIKMKMDGALIGANGTNVAAGNGLAWCVSVNGLANGHRSILLSDPLADQYPSTARIYNSITNALMLMFVPSTNSSTPFAYRMWGVGEWEFISSAQGVHMSGSGHMFIAAGNESFFVHGGVSDNDDWSGRNVVTQFIFGIYNVTNGAAWAAHTSNAIVRLWGLKQ